MARTLLLLMLIKVVSGQSVGLLPNSTLWPCSNVTPHQDMQLEKVLGQWYLIEIISFRPSRADICAGIELVQNDPTSWNNITMIGQELTSDGSMSYDNHTIIIPDPANYPAVWDQPDIGSTVVITDVGPYNDTLALTTCQWYLQYIWTGVFSRERSLNSTVLELVNEQLRTAGVENVDTAVVLNSTACTAAESITP